MADDPVLDPPTGPSDPAPADPAPEPPTDPTPVPVPVPPAAFTYGDPDASPLWALRFTIGDTSEKTAFLTDVELNYLLKKNGGDLSAAAVGAVVKIMAKLARLCDETVGSVSKSWSQMRDGYKGLLLDLRRDASSYGGAPFIGGISYTANRQPYLNKDTVRPQFTTRMMRRTNRIRGIVPGGYLDDSPYNGPESDAE